eukprot:8196854-Pyramimonas_sp.AAC.1
MGSARPHVTGGRPSRSTSKSWGFRRANWNLACGSCGAPGRAVSSDWPWRAWATSSWRATPTTRNGTP